MKLIFLGGNSGVKSVKTSMNEILATIGMISQAMGKPTLMPLAVRVLELMKTMAIMEAMIAITDLDILLWIAAGAFAAVVVGCIMIALVGD